MERELDDVADKKSGQAWRPARSVSFSLLLAGVIMHERLDIVVAQRIEFLLHRLRLLAIAGTILGKRHLQVAGPLARQDTPRQIPAPGM